MLFLSFVFSQSNETANLLKQSEEEAFTHPSETVKTVNFLLASQTDSNIKPQLYLLLSRASFTTGNYENALKNAFTAKNSAQKSGNEKVFSESLMVISRVLSFLQLQNEARQINQNLPESLSAKLFLKLQGTSQLNPRKSVSELKKIISSKPGDSKSNRMIQNEALEALSKNYIELNLFDSAVYFARQAVAQTEKFHLGNYFQAKSGVALGDVYFWGKENDSAQNAYFSALEKSKSFNNPFLKEEIHHKLSTAFLADKDIVKFNYHNQQALNFEKLADANENAAANSAYQLLSAEQDKKLNSEKSKFRTVFWALCGLVLLLVLLKIFLFFRNKNSIKTYETLNSYLNKQNQNSSETDRKPALEQESKGSGLLKESEEQILAGLTKFESSGKFTNKDMSLGMLAAQLNTNTKYLSETINRHKQKNFNSYINELRVNYITEKIKNDANYLNYKVSYLAEESGFSSHSSFTTVFKSIVGISPIAFVELIKNQKETVL